MLRKLVVFLFLHKKFLKIFSQQIFITLEHPLWKNQLYKLYIFIGVKTTSLYSTEVFNNFSLFYGST